MDFRDLIQIAGIHDAAEAKLITDCGVSCLGFPLRLPVHKEDLNEAEAAQLIGALRPPCSAVLITYLDNAGEIEELCGNIGAQAVQLHGEISHAETLRLRSERPQLGIIKSLIVKGNNLDELSSQVRLFSCCVDAFITDSFDPVSGACGATGKTHDWELSRQLVVFSPRPVILAGGLNPANVREAIRRVNPSGVDAHTGVEGSDGRKDRALLARFVAEAQLGFSERRQQQSCNSAK